MKLYYFTDSPNFGDNLNAWLWQRLLPDRWDPCDEVCFSGIGTIINANMPWAREWVVFTSGVGYGGRPKDFGSSNWQVLSVRGPLSAAVLGLANDAAVTDGALLLASLPEMAPLPEAERCGTVFIPHFETERDAAWPEACRRAGIEYLDPLTDSRAVVDRIRRARLVIAEAMHGAIIADTLRVPFVPVVSSPLISSFKWLDWTLSMEIPYRPLALHPSSMRSAWRNRMLWSYGQTHRASNTSKKTALSYYRRRYEAGPDPIRNSINRIGRRIHRRVDRLIEQPGFTAWKARQDEVALDRAAADLVRAAATSGLLSEQSVHAAQLERLTTRMERLQ